MLTVGKTINAGQLHAHWVVVIKTLDCILAVMLLVGKENYIVLSNN